MTTREFVLAIKADPASAVRALQQLGDKGQAALDRIRSASTPASGGLQAINAVSSELSNRIDDLASRTGGFGRVLASLGPLGLAAGAAIGGLTSVFLAGTRELAQYEAAVGRLDAVLRATGNTTGLSSGQIRSFADQLEKSTAATEEQVLAAAASIATFGSVTGDNFTRVLRLGQDLAATFGGDIKSNAETLASALANPAEGLGRLDKNIKGVLGSNLQLIEGLLKSGKQAEATALLLKTLEGAVGGAGDARGVVGSTDQLAKSWEDLLKVFGNTTFFQLQVEGLTAINRALTDLLDTSDDARFVSLVEKRIKLQKEFDNGSSLTKFLLERPIRINQQELDEISKRRDAAAATEQIAQESARQTAADAKILADYNAWIKAYDEQQEKRRKAAQKIADEAQKRIAAIQQEIGLGELKLKGDEKLLFIQEQLAKLPEGTGRKQVEQAEKLAAALFDQKTAIEGQQAAQKALLKQQEETAQQAAELWNRPILRAAENIQDAFAGAFENILNGGVDSFGELGKQIKSIFTKTLAEVLSANLVRPVVGSLLGGLLSSGSASAANVSGGGGISGSSLLQLGSNFLPTGGLAVGAINSLGLSGLTGALGLTTTAAGPTLSGAAGYAAGLTGFGSVALPVAGIGLGLLASGLLGNKKPSNKSAGAFFDPNTGALFQNAGGTVAGVSTPKGTENLDRFNQVAAQINAALKSIRDLTGGNFSGGLFNVALGSRDAGFVVANGQKTTFANDQALVEGAVRTALGGLTGTNAEFQSILSANATKPINDLLAALALPGQRRDFNNGVADELLRLRDPQGFALRELDRERDARIKQAQEIGADILQIEELYAARRKEITQQSNNDLINLQRGLFDTLLGSNSALSSAEKLALSRSQLESTAQAALGGDAAARNNFSAVANQFLGLSRDFNASGGAFQADFARATGLFQQILGSGGGNNVVAAIDRQTAVGTDNSNNLQQTMQAVRDLLAQLNERLTRGDVRPAGA